MQRRKRGRDEVCVCCQGQFVRCCIESVFCATHLAMVQQRCCKCCNSGLAELGRFHRVHESRPELFSINTAGICWNFLFLNDDGKALTVGALITVQCMSVIINVGDGRRWMLDGHDSLHVLASHNTGCAHLGHHSAKFPHDLPRNRKK